MIFATVGLHRKGFERLLRNVDGFVRDHQIKKAFMQIGYTDFVPRHCKWQRFMSVEIMKRVIGESNVIVTHAGAGTIMTVMQQGRLPIIVPRRVEFNEHTNNHQLDLAARMESVYKAAVIWDIGELDAAIKTNLEKESSWKFQGNSRILRILERFIDTVE